MNWLFPSDGRSIGASASVSVLLINIQDLISFRINWFDIPAVQGTLKSLLQHLNLKASILQCSAFFMVQISRSACNAGDPSLIHGLGRSTGEGIGYSLQYSWASIMAQLVKNPPAMRETWVQVPGWEDSLENGKTTHSSILGGRIPGTV